MNLWLFYAEHLLCERGKKSWSNKRTESTKTVLGSSIRKFFDIVELELDNESMPVSKFSFGKKIYKGGVLLELENSWLNGSAIGKRIK